MTVLIQEISQMWFFEEFLKEKKNEDEIKIFLIE